MGDPVVGAGLFGSEYHRSFTTDATILLDGDGLPLLAEDYVWPFTVGAG